MRFYTSDESGLVKGVEIDPNVSLLEAQQQAAKRVRAEAKARANATKDGDRKGLPTGASDLSLAGVDLWTVNGKVQRNRSIEQMCQWTDQLVVARANGEIEAIERESGDSLFKFEEPQFTESFSVKHRGQAITKRRFVGLGAADGHFVACTNMGEIRYQGFSDNEAKLMMKVPLDAWCMRMHQELPGVFAVGGREQELTLWDAETVEVDQPGSSGYSAAKSAPLFKGQNVPNDNLGLRVPVWITDIQFLDKGALPTLAVSTGHKQVRIYDTKAQSLPVQDWEVGEHPIMHMIASHTKPEVYFADNRGNVNQLDLRMGKVVGGFKGISGAVRAMALSEDATKLAVGGLDRFLRVYEAGGMRRALHRAYIKQRVTQVVWDWDHKDLSTDEIEQQETEDIWDNMATTKKRKAVASS